MKERSLLNRQDLRFEHKKGASFEAPFLFTIVYEGRISEIWGF